MSRVVFHPATVAALRRRLLGWFDEHRRRLPWRESPSAYGTWIAEIMLQQTTVKAVVPYWSDFLVRFPDVQRLAEASEEEILAAWSGLGYYRRARALHLAARRIVTDFDGCLPRGRDQWRLLPGIGSYTAGAIASIANGEAVGAVDANVRRVVSRWGATSSDQATQFGQKDLEAAADRLVDPGRPGDWNQAVMELGALICSPSTPSCADCPVKRLCRAYRSGWIDGPERASVRSDSTTAVWLSMLVLRRGGEVLMVPAGRSCNLDVGSWGKPVRNDLKDLFAGMWQLPSSAWYADASASARVGVAADPPANLPEVWRGWLRKRDDCLVVRLRQLGVVRHAVTRFRLRIWVVGGSLERRSRHELAGVRWFRPHQREPLPIAAMSRKALSCW